MRGIAIAEGDTRSLYFVGLPRIAVIISHTLLLPPGLASELLLGRYAVEPPRYPDSLLAKHEMGSFRSSEPSLPLRRAIEALRTTGRSFRARSRLYKRLATVCRTMQRALREWMPLFLTCSKSRRLFAR